MDDELASTKLIAEGKCPGYSDFNYDLPRDARYGDFYAVDLKGAARWAPCGKKITRGDLCGMHDNVRNRARAKRAEAARRVEQRRALEKEANYATNLAMFLNDALAPLCEPNQPVTFSSYGSNITLGPEQGRRLLDRLKEIAAALR